MFAALTIITGVAYPAIITIIAQVAFPHEANGSLIERDGKVIGSELIGQRFDAPKYFWSRPSATSPAYNAESSTGSNLGPTNPAQLDAVRDRVAAIKKAHPDQTGPVPIDLVTASASGLDPHITLAAANYQTARVAKARDLSVGAVRKAIADNSENRTLGLLGEPRVNVLKLNLALDASQK
jgi:K+-transporting ATPase ATPase C chain